MAKRPALDGSLTSALAPKRGPRALHVLAVPQTSLTDFFFGLQAIGNWRERAATLELAIHLLHFTMRPVYQDEAFGRRARGAS
jgi:hypothetical protein